MSLLNANTNVIPTYKPPKFIPSTELQLIMDRAAEEGFNIPNATTQTAIDTLITAMKADNYWQAQDSILNFAYNDTSLANFSRINWKNPFSITNLVTFSSDWSNAGWTIGNGGTKSPNTLDTTAPDGTFTACKFDDSTAIGAGTATKTGIIANATTVTYSIYTKAGTATTRSFALRNATTGTTFDIATLNYSTGVIGGDGNWNVINVGNGWFRVYYTRSTGITVGDTLQIYYGWTGQPPLSTSWYCWGAQVEDRSTVSRYIPTTTTAIFGNGLASFHGGLLYTVNGVEGNAIDAYVNTHFNPAQTGVNYTLNNAGINANVYKPGSNPTNAVVVGNSIGTTDILSNINGLTQRINNPQNLVSPIDMTSTGMKFIMRTTSTSIKLVNKSVQTDIVVPAATARVSQFQILLSRSNIVFTDVGAGFYNSGSSLTYNQSQNFRNYYNAYLIRIGLLPIT